VYIVDDDPDIGRALGRLLRAAGYRPVIFQTAHHFLNEYDPAAPGCLILDYRMPELDGLAVQTLLKESGSRHPIVFLTGLGTIPLTVDAVKAGAINVLTKPIDETTLLSAVAEAVEVDRGRRSRQERSGELLDRYSTLTAREREVMALVVKGRLNKQIAAELGTVEKTIKVHRARAMEKMRAASLAELVRLALSVEQELSARSGNDEEQATVAGSEQPGRTGHHRGAETHPPKSRSLFSMPLAYHPRVHVRAESVRRLQEETGSSPERADLQMCELPGAAE